MFIPHTDVPRLGASIYATHPAIPLPLFVGLRWLPVGLLALAFVATTGVTRLALPHCGAWLVTDCTRVDSSRCIAAVVPTVHCYLPGYVALYVWLLLDVGLRLHGHLFARVIPLRLPHVATRWLPVAVVGWLTRYVWLCYVTLVVTFPLPHCPVTARFPDATIWLRLIPSLHAVGLRLRCGCCWWLPAPLPRFNYIAFHVTLPAFATAGVTHAPGAVVDYHVTRMTTPLRYVWLPVVTAGYVYPLRHG